MWLYADWLAENEYARMTRDAGMVRVCRDLGNSKIPGNFAAACSARAGVRNSGDAVVVLATIASDRDDESAAGVS